MRRLVFVLLLAAPLAAPAAVSGYRLDRSPHDPNDLASLQAGARTFVNYCLNCHGAQYLRFNRLVEIGLTEAQIKDNLMFAAEKVGETMRTALGPRDGKLWFGVAPPDLSVIARSRGADWLYSYLRTFYRDPKTPIGWNNAVYPNAAMPHALWTLQGERGLEIVPRAGQAGHVSLEYQWTALRPGTQSAVEYDTTVRDLVNFLVWVGEPAAQSRKRIGIVVLFVLGALFVLAYALKKEYWKDVK
jgi:ubiquinol-cytochrome c reductase cytochrome c1 subunit